MFASFLAPLQSVPEMATDDRFGEMLKFFAIAVVIVAPACWVTWRRAAKRAARLNAEAAAALAGPDSDEVAADDEPDPHDLKTVVAAIDHAARALAAGQSVALEVPGALTLDGSAAPPALVDSLLGDAIARNRVDARWESVDGGSIVTLSR